MVFLSDHADMCCTHLSRVFRDQNMLLVSCFPKLYVLDLTMEVAQIRAEDVKLKVNEVKGNKM